MKYYGEIREVDNRPMDAYERYLEARVEALLQERRRLLAELAEFKAKEKQEAN